MATVPQNNEPLLLGVEGGGTRTVALVVNAAHQLIQRIEFGPSNLHLLSDSELQRALNAIARQALKPAAIAIGLAGLRTESDRQRVLAAADRTWPKIPCRAVADLETGLAAAPPASRKVTARVLVLSGTGSCCFGRRPDGRSSKLGGWGHLLGDKGSAYEIGLRALKAVVFYSDRDGEWPKLGAQILRTLQLNTPEDLVDWAHQAQKQAVAALALDVFEAWKGGDKIARDILEGAAHSLANDAAHCARRLARPQDRVQFILAGSVLLKQPRFAQRVTAILRKLWPHAEVTRLHRESAWGAVELAHKALIQQPCDRDRDGGEPPSGRVLQPVSLRTPTQQAPVYVPRATSMSPTEQRNPRSMHLDRMSLRQGIVLMLSEEGRVPAILRQYQATIASCVRRIARCFAQGGRLFYVGAGTSGRLGVLDASECPPTFRVSPQQVQGIMAGGPQALWQSLEGAEDDGNAGAAAVQGRAVTHRDIVIGIAASGRTPFVWGALNEAKRRGAETVLVCFNPYLAIEKRYRPDVVLAIDVGPEVLTGSTRLKAGTATKLLLNLFTTLAMVRRGKVVGNLMVDLNPSNEKLRDRAVRIVVELTGMSAVDAKAALEKSHWVIQKAIGNSRRRRSTLRQNEI